MRLKKVVCLFLAILTIFSCLSIAASAKTLADCFTSGSNKTFEYVDYGLGNGENYYYKTAWGKTEGYGSKHYVRCYLNAKKFYGDTDRVWSTYPHNYHYVETEKVWTGAGLTGSLAIGYTAYAKYGLPS